MTSKELGLGWGCTAAFDAEGAGVYVKNITQRQLIIPSHHHIIPPALPFPAQDVFGCSCRGRDGVRQRSHRSYEQQVGGRQLEEAEHRRQERTGKIASADDPKVGTVIHSVNGAVIASTKSLGFAISKDQRLSQNILKTISGSFKCVS